MRCWKCHRKFDSKRGAKWIGSWTQQQYYMTDKYIYIYIIYIYIQYIYNIYIYYIYICKIATILRGGRTQNVSYMFQGVLEGGIEHVSLHFEGILKTFPTKTIPGGCSGTNFTFKGGSPKMYLTFLLGPPLKSSLKGGGDFVSICMLCFLWPWYLGQISWPIEGRMNLENRYELGDPPIEL